MTVGSPFEKTAQHDRLELPAFAPSAREDDARVGRRTALHDAITARIELIDALFGLERGRIRRRPQRKASAEGTRDKSLHILIGRRTLAGGHVEQPSEAIQLLHREEPTVGPAAVQDFTSRRCCMRRYLGLLFSVSLVTFAPSVAGGQVPSSADSLVLERTRCFGTCPAYRLRIARDGAVDFQSRNPGESTRVRETVAPQTLGELIGAADRAGFFGLPTRVESDRELCAVTATDHPSVTITVFGATTSAVHYYTGCYIRSRDSTSTSPAPGITRHPRLTRLSAFTNAIDSALGSARWVRSAARR